MSNNVPKGYTRLEPKPINELGKEFQPQEVQAHMMRYTTQPPPNLAVSPFERLTQCMVTGAVKDIILATPGYPMQPAQPKSRAYRIAPSPGAGLGMFATRPLAEGDLIVSERAILIVPAMMQAMQPNIDSLGLTDAEKRAITIHSGETQLRDAFNRMIPVEQANYMALADSAQRQEGGNWPPLSGRLHTNAYGLNNLRNPGVDGAHGIYAGVFNELSRINHSCRPNCLRRFHLPSFSMRIYTVRDIAVGEEITLNYNAEWMTADRQKSLQGYGFQCRCPSCLDAKASDQRRVIIEREYSWDAVKKWILSYVTKRRGTTSMLLKHAEDGIRLIELEGLQGHDSYYENALMLMLSVLAAIGTDGERFRKYGLLLLKKWIAEGRNLGQMFETFQENIAGCWRVRYEAPTKPKKASKAARRK